MRQQKGFNPAEVCQAIMDAGSIILERLLNSDDLKDLEDRIRDTVGLTIQILVDEIRDTYDLVKNN